MIPQFANPPPCIFPLTKEEAYARITDKQQNIRMMFQPDIGEINKEYRAIIQEVRLLIDNAQLIEESGSVAQNMDMGVYIFIRHSVFGPGMLFIETKPECRMTELQIREREIKRTAELLAASRLKTDSRVN